MTEIVGLDLVPSGYLDEVVEAASRAKRAGAIEPLMYLGIGMTSVVFEDGRKLAFKVGRLGRSAEEMLETEASWFRLASQIPEVSRHVARFVGYDAKLHVLVREALRGSRARESSAFAIHRHIDKALRPYGYGAPEYKAESYIVVRGRGPVLFDASMPNLFGRALVARALALAGGRVRSREPSEFRDVAWAVKWERGGTIPARVADGVLVRLGCASDVALEYLREDSDMAALAERAVRCRSSHGRERGHR